MFILVQHLPTFSKISDKFFASSNKGVLIFKIFFIFFITFFLSRVIYYVLKSFLDSWMNKKENDYNQEKMESMIDSIKKDLLSSRSSPIATTIPETLGTSNKQNDLLLSIIRDLDWGEGNYLKKINDKINPFWETESNFHRKKLKDSADQLKIQLNAIAISTGKKQTLLNATDLLTLITDHFLMLELIAECKRGSEHDKSDKSDKSDKNKIICSLESLWTIPAGEIITALELLLLLFQKTAIEQIINRIMIKVIANNDRSISQLSLVKDYQLAITKGLIKFQLWAINGHSNFTETLFALKLSCKVIKEITNLCQGRGCSPVAKKIFNYQTISLAHKALDVVVGEQLSVIKKKYNQNALRFHPDRVAKVGDAKEIEILNQKFSDLTAAYELVKEFREKNQIAQELLKKSSLTNIF